MKKLIFALALCCATVVATATEIETPAHTGPGVQTTVGINVYDPILASIHLAKGGWSPYQKVVGWNNHTEEVSVFISDVTLREKGYEYRNGVPLKPTTTTPGYTMPWEWLWYSLCTILGLGVIVLFTVEIVRRLRAPLPQPVAPVQPPVVNHNYYAAAPRTVPNVPSYTTANINSMFIEIKNGNRSGRMIYQNGDELLVLEADPTTGAGAAPVAPAAAATPQGKQ
ncbi:MAG: hypothetical protein WCG55_03720 [bacterium]